MSASLILTPVGIPLGVAFGSDAKTGLGGGGGDQFDDGAVGHQWSAAPVHGDEAEHAMLDPVPFGGARRVVADRDRYLDLIRHLLQVELPCAKSISVAPPGIGADE